MIAVAPDSIKEVRKLLEKEGIIAQSFGKITAQKEEVVRVV